MVGVFRRRRSNPFNLVDDLIEPFRPVIDHAVAHLYIGDELPLRRETRTALVAAADCQFLKTSESISTVFQIILIEIKICLIAQIFLSYFYNTLDYLSLLIWKFT